MEAKLLLCYFHWLLLSALTVSFLYWHCTALIKQDSRPIPSHHCTRKSKQFEKSVENPSGLRQHAIRFCHPENGFGTVALFGLAFEKGCIQRKLLRVQRAHSEPCIYTKSIDLQSVQKLLLSSLKYISFSKYFQYLKYTDTLYAPRLTLHNHFSEPKTLQSKTMSSHEALLYQCKHCYMTSYLNRHPEINI